MNDYSKWILYYPEDLDTSKTLWLVRDIGDVDALHGSGINACSYRTKDAYEKAAPFFQSFPSVFVAISEQETRVTASEIADKLADFSPQLPIILPREGAFGQFKSVADAMRGGRAKVEGLMMGAVERPVSGLVNVADIPYVDFSQELVAVSGYPELDAIAGGFGAGELSIWTASEGQGKTTLLGQIMLTCINDGFPVCVYSGEMDKAHYKAWIAQQAAGAKYTHSSQNPWSKKWFSIVNQDVLPLIDRWINNKLFLVDKKTLNSDSVEKIVELFAYGMRRYSCCMFLVDNLMTVQTQARTTSDNDRQEKIVLALKDFATVTGTHVHLVAHLKKLNGVGKKGTDCIYGSSVIKNTADKIFAIERIDDEEKEAVGYDTGINVWKNRTDGMLGTVKLNFDPQGRRLYPIGGNPEAIRYGWEFQKRIP